jgi:homocysteine S-methyltransferase
MGADFSVTQPIYDPESFIRWKDKISEIYKPHFVGIWPFISLKNAEFMANEVPGVHVPQWALEEMQKAGENRDEAIKRGLGIAFTVMDKLKDECEGFAVSAPLGKVDVALELYKQFGVAR